MGHVTIQCNWGQVRGYADGRGFQTLVQGDGKVEDELVVAFSDRGERYGREMLGDICDRRVEKFIYDPLPHWPGQAPDPIAARHLYASLPQTLGRAWDLDGNFSDSQGRHSASARLVPDGSSYQRLHVNYDRSEVMLETHVDGATGSQNPDLMEHWVLACFDPATGRVRPETVREQMVFTSEDSKDYLYSGS